MPEQTSAKAAKARALAARFPAAPAGFGTVMPPPSQPGLSRHHSLALGIYLVYLFMEVSRAPELIVIPKLMLIFGVLAFLTGGLVGDLRGFYSPMGLWMTAWLLLSAGSILFSYWKTDSIRTLVQWAAPLLIFYIGAQLLTSVETLQKAVRAVAYSGILVLATAFVFRGSIADRLQITQGGTLADPNDFASALLFMAPALVVAFWRSRMRKVLLVLLLTGMLLAVLRTGSRGALLTLAVMLLASFWALPLGKKLVFGAGALIVVLAGMAALPDTVRARYSTLWSSVPAAVEGASARDISQAQVSAHESTMARAYVLSAALRSTLQHPLSGVGIGQSQLGINEIFTDSWHMRASWHEAHNTYLQVAAETGLPGFFAYLAILFTCFRATGRAIQQSRGKVELRELYALARCGRLMLISYSVSSAFLTHAYQFYVPVLAVLCAGMRCCLQAAAPAATLAASAAPAGVHAGNTGVMRRISAT